MSDQQKEEAKQPERNKFINVDLGNPHLQKIQTRQVISASYQGPFPPPEMLAKYENILPGFTERTMKILEKQTDHRFRSEDKIIDKSFSHQKTGLWLGGGICALAILSGTAISIINPESAAGFAVIISALAGLVGVFVTGVVISKKAERTEEIAIDQTDELPPHISKM
ncbi:DUF2335 domain-containing protein [Leptospira gomenensis]|uniref:DUF2335 domain-containing protein n=1 Tax=Leptospira gomenensis TaxID=2484974 RepID=A0A5F1YHS7_9LEPT|nr:DUF2335 domain-containing protein [Leptospira gomenensis]TGK36205.1 DUF2335 domain-containing protein [Leptospira gomenensis]TGK42757.1 DUF2335 domain-containing protein [Leptospira gomenensis]TGK42945.1 DUF2335 domain-containing protein [Leptospira gomenensis]TGK54956.1 DUF2335 domain-containing protein [Leptospira gomenensis]